MIITTVCIRGVKMFVRAYRENMFLAAVYSMFFKFAVCAHEFKCLAVITSNDFNSLLYEYTNVGKKDGQ